jgi:hypothetical protein
VLQSIEARDFYIAFQATPEGRKVYEYLMSAFYDRLSYSPGEKREDTFFFEGQRSVVMDIKDMLDNYEASTEEAVEQIEIEDENLSDFSLDF